MTTQEMIEVALGFAHIATEPYEPRGIFPSEMALVLGLCRKLEVDVVIESGRARGYSTYLLAKYLPHGERYPEVVSIDRWRDGDALFAEGRLKAYGNVQLDYGDGCELVKEWVDRSDWGRVAVLLDGPKGHPALRVLASCPKIAVGFIHDMRQLDHGKPAPFRLEAEKRGGWFTDDPEYMAATKHLDAPVWAIGAASKCEPFHIEGKFIGSYGPTLGVFLSAGST